MKGAAAPFVLAKKRKKQIKNLFFTINFPALYPIYNKEDRKTRSNK